MAAFSFEHCPSPLDSALPPNAAIKMCDLLEDGEMNASSFSFPDISFAPTANASSSFGNGAASALDQLTSDSSSFAAEVANQLVKADRKKKNRDGSCLNSPHSKGEKGRKQKNSTKDTEETRKRKAEKRNQKEANDLPPTGYIHVRARRGQATDSHSLAERARREKISERMKLLQGLVPGCGKVVGKALVLDEIINYVQSLQNQVEFLSMKLAFQGFRVDFDDCTAATSQRPISPLHFQGLQQSNPSPANALQDTSHATFAATSNYPLMNGPDPHLLHQHSPESFSEENANLVWQMEMQREKLVNQAVYNNLCPFQGKGSEY